MAVCLQCKALQGLQQSCGYFFQQLHLAQHSQGPGRLPLFQDQAEMEQSGSAGWIRAEQEMVGSFKKPFGFQRVKFWLRLRLDRPGRFLGSGPGLWTPLHCLCCPGYPVFTRRVARGFACRLCARLLFAAQLSRMSASQIKGSEALKRHLGRISCWRGWSPGHLWPAAFLMSVQVKDDKTDIFFLSAVILIFLFFFLEKVK